MSNNVVIRGNPAALVVNKAPIAMKALIKSLEQARISLGLSVARARHSTRELALEIA
jgi:hypothetical protein